MSGKMRRFKIRYSDGTIRTVSARSHKGAKEVFQVRYQPPPGECIVVWPQGDNDNKRNMRTMGGTSGRASSGRHTEKRAIKAVIDRATGSTSGRASSGRHTERRVIKAVIDGRRVLIVDDEDR